ncbi:MAG: hypothetical protein K2L11_01840 [Muribaculaceae bacterium]|nr:hypothetical protein [Muribaculaceae bacterium]
MRRMFDNLKKAARGFSNILEEAASAKSNLPLDSLKKTVNGLSNKLENVISAAGGDSKVNPEAATISAALEKSPIRAIPFRSNRLYLQIDATDIIPEDWYVLVDMNEERIKFTTSIEADLAENFRNAGFDAVYKYPLTMITKEVPMKEISGIKALGKIITDIVKRQEKVLEEFAQTDDYIITMLDVMVFDHENIVKAMEHSKYFEKIDDDGDVMLKVAPTDDCMYERFIWVLPKPDRIVLDCGISGVTYPDNLEAIAKEMEASADGIKFKANEGKLRLKAYIDPEDYPAEDIPENIFKIIDSTVEKLLATWGEVLKKMNVRTNADQFFNIPVIQEKLKKAPDFEKIDEDGDMMFRVEGDDSFQPTRFVWVILKKDSVVLEAGIWGYTHTGATVAPEDVVKKFNKDSSGFEAYVTDNTVRIRKRFNLNDYPSANPTRKLIEDVKGWYMKTLEAITTVAKLADIKVKYYRPEISILEKIVPKDYFGKMTFGSKDATLQLKQSKTTDGDLLSTSIITIKTKDSVVDYELNVQLEKSCSDNDTLDLAKQNASSLAKSIHQRVDCKCSSNSIMLYFSVPNHTFDTAMDFIDIFTEGVKTLMELDSKGSDLALEAYKKEIKEKRERERRRQEEERERERQRQAAIAAAREKELDAGFSYTLRSTGTIRKLQEGFTEDYPYLNIAVYMVKTGKEADRSGGTIYSYSSGTTFGEIRSFKGDCKVRIEGRSTPQSLEKQFRDVSGLVIKIGYNDENDNRYYITKDSSWHKMHICDLNREFRKAGYYKADIS